MASFQWQGIWDYGLATTLMVLHVSGILMAARVILSHRSTQGTIAWALGLILLPMAAVPLYLVFGRNRLRSYIVAKHKVDEEFSRQHPQVKQQHAGIRGVKWNFLTGLISARGMTEGNIIEVFFSGRETYDSIIEGIGRAKKYIIFQFFIFRDDPEGRVFKEKLIEKAKRGIRVYFLVDAIGSRRLRRRFYKELTDAGIEVGLFSPGTSLRSRLRLNFRNHRKVVIVDGQEAWMGGLNIGMEYVGKDPRFGNWRDTHARVKGDVIDNIQLAFLEDWYWVKREMPPMDWDQLPAEPGNSKALCLATGPTDMTETCTLAFVHLINRASRRLWIHSPYFVPSDEIIVALQLATLRGVDVRILLPSKADHRLVWISSYYFSSLPQLDKVLFYRYQNGFLHSKMLLLDDDVVALGTVNFDNRSFHINFEATLLIEDRDIVRECDRQMRADFAQSIEDPMDPLAEKGLFFRLAARSTRLLAPLL